MDRGHGAHGRGLGDERRTPVEVGGDPVGVAVVQFQQPGVLPQDAEFRASVNRMLVLGTAAAAALALLLGTALARRATAPARALTETARSLAAGDRSARVPAQRHDEFGEMARAFNRMADTVSAEDRVRRDFAADVAHELRTPLMILRGEIEALQDGIASPTPELVPIMGGDPHWIAAEAGRLEVETPIVVDADLSVSEAYGMLGHYGHSDMPNHSFALVRRDGELTWVHHYAEMFVPADRFFSDLPA